MSAAPQDRPPLSMPTAALRLLTYLYLLIGSVPALCLMVLGPLRGTSSDLLSGHLLGYILIVGGWLLFVLFSVRSGRRAGIRLFRGTATGLAVTMAVGLFGAALVTFGLAGDGVRHARLTGQFTLLGLLVCLPLAIVLLRGIGRVRWLDPLSTPDEWEPPARRSDATLKAMIRRPPDD